MEQNSFLVRRRKDGSREKIQIQNARVNEYRQTVEIVLPDGSRRRIPRDQVLVYRLHGSLHMPWW